MDPARAAHPLIVHIGEENEQGGKKQQFSEIYIPSGDTVEVSDIKDPGEEKPAQKSHGRTVGRDDAGVTEHESPPTYEGCLCAKADIGVCKCSSGNGIDLDEDAISQSYEAHQPPANDEPDECGQRAGIG